MRLDDPFRALCDRLLDPQHLNPAASRPLFYFTYPPEDALRVKERLPSWTAMIEHRGRRVVRVSLSEILWATIDASGRWPLWLTMEPRFSLEDFNKSVAASLETGFLPKLESRLAEVPADGIVLVTDTEFLHPWFRSRAIETCLMESLRVPAVIFYPGRRSGQYGLEFLGFYEVDGNYRSTIFGVE